MKSKLRKAQLRKLEEEIGPGFEMIEQVFTGAGDLRRQRPGGGPKVTWLWETIQAHVDRSDWTSAYILFSCPVANFLTELVDRVISELQNSG